MTALGTYVGVQVDFLVFLRSPPTGCYQATFQLYTDPGSDATGPGPFLSPPASSGLQPSHTWAVILPALPSPALPSPAMPASPALPCPASHCLARPRLPCFAPPRRAEPCRACLALPCPALSRLTWLCLPCRALSRRTSPRRA